LGQALDKKYVLFDFRGRIGRKAFWLATAVQFPLIAIGSAVSWLSPDDIETLFSADPQQLRPSPMLLVVLVIVAGLSLSVLAAASAKRLHDRNRSGFWLSAPAVLVVSGLLAGPWGAPTVLRAICAVTALIALPITTWLIVELGFLKGNPGPNRFGPDTTNSPSGFKARRMNRGEVVSAMIRGILSSPIGILIVLPLRLIQLLLTVVQKRHVLFGFKGRIGRRDFWLLTLLTFAVTIIFDGVVVYFGALLAGENFDDVEWSEAAKPLHLAFVGVTIWALAAIVGKRLHDRNHSVWWIAALSPVFIIALLPFLGPSAKVESILDGLVIICLPVALWLIVELGFLKGTPGPNRFGPERVKSPKPGVVRSES
jgi:uncharacterized membrane protein YhaH (DUF805 family)